MGKLLLNKHKYVIVNIWTSDQNKALKGANVGHVSLTTSRAHMSLWPGKEEIPRGYLKKRTAKKTDYLGRYERDCMRETLSESGEYVFCLKGYELCFMGGDDAPIEENKVYVRAANEYPLSLVPSSASFEKNKLYVALNKDGSLRYVALTPSNQQIMGSISRGRLEEISDELVGLNAPLTADNLEMLEPFYDALVQEMPENVHKLLSKVVIKYAVKAPSGKEIKDTINLDTIPSLSEALLEGTDKISLQEFLPSILKITSNRGHTRANAQEVVVESRKIYFEVTTDGCLKYTVKKSAKETVSRLINGKALGEIDGSLKELVDSREPLDLRTLQLLKRFYFQILNLTATVGDTKEVLIRPADSSTELLQGEELYRYDSENKTYLPIEGIPDEGDNIFAIKLVHANCRVVLYSLNDGQINQKFEEMKKSGGVTGWTMQGSNFFTRMSDEADENCSSLAYRLLSAGGIYKSLDSGITTQTTSVVTPDDLLRHVVAMKEKEIKALPKSEDWKTDGVDNASLETARREYKRIGESANAEEGFFSSRIPSLPRSLFW